MISIKKFGLWVLVLFALIGIGSAGYYFLKPIAPNVSLEFVKPDRIFVGAPFVVTVTYSNPSDQILKDSKLSLLLPPEFSFAGKSLDQRGQDIPIGDIGPGSVAQETVNLIALSGADSIKQLDISLDYSLANSPNTPYQVSKNLDLEIGAAVVGLTLVTPQGASNGENFDISVKYKNDSGADLKNLKLKLSYPQEFKYLSSNKDGSQSNTEWTIPVLMANQSDELIVTGNLNGVDLSKYKFSATVTADYLGQTYILNTQDSETSISPSALSMGITVNGSDPNSYSAKAGETLTYEVSYRNNSQVPLSNLRLSATLSGVMFDFSKLVTKGVFNSLTNMVSWSQQNASELAVLNPGDSGKMTFQTKVKDNFPIVRMGDKDFTLKVGLNLESPTVPTGVAAEKTVSLASVETKIMGQAVLSAKGYFYDAASGILNSGPYPPQVNKKTQYTIHWAIANYSTDLSNVVITGRIIPGVNFTGTVKSNISSEPSFNSETGTVTWNVGSVPATKGLISDPIEAIFQIEATPSSLDAGNAVPIFGESRLDATDAWTGQSLSATAPIVNTDLPYDTKLPPNVDRRVRQ